MVDELLENSYSDHNCLDLERNIKDDMENINSTLSEKEMVIDVKENIEGEIISQGDGLCEVYIGNLEQEIKYEKINNVVSENEMDINVKKNIDSEIISQGDHLCKVYMGNFEQDIKYEKMNNVVPENELDINVKENIDSESVSEGGLCEVHIGNLSIYKNGVQLKNYYRKFEVIPLKIRQNLNHSKSVKVA